MQADHRLVPDGLKQALEDYRDKGWEPGGFLTACLANDFLGAFKRADYLSMASLPHIAAWIYWETPSDSHGSYEAVGRWCTERQLDQMKQETEK